MALDAAELAELQADLVSQVCDQSVQLFKPTATSDAYGSPANSYPNTPTATTVCGVRIPTASELQNYDYKIGDKAAYHVDFPVGTQIGEQWRAVIGGQTLEVHVLLTPQSYPGLLSTICVQIK